jgi:PAS domain S-box-containing protein
MAAQPASSAEEVKGLRRCINDLVSILALPATWTGSQRSRIVEDLLDALLSMLGLDFAYAQLRDPTDQRLELMRTSPAWEATPLAQEIGQKLQAWLEKGSQTWPHVGRTTFEGQELSVASLLLGLHGEMGTIVAGSRRVDFPQQTEGLILSVAANQAAIGLRETNLRGALDQLVGERTRELVVANEALREAHTRIAQSEERWRSIFENSAVGVALADLNGRHIAANPVFQGMVGYTEEELKQFNFTDITVEEDRTLNWALVQELLKGKRRQFQIEKRYRRKNGSTFWVRNSVSVVPGTGREPRFLMALSEDVTERRQAEEALNETRSELAHMAPITTLSTLTASIAHEVNQPLSGIVTNASTCLRMLDANPPNLEGARETARRTIRDGNRASEVIARLRSLFSKRNAQFEMFDLNEAVKEVVALSVSELKRNGVILQLDLALDLPSLVGDQIQIQQVILNLLRNGWDAMNAVEDRPRELLIMTERDDSGGLRLTVKDSGVGIDSEIEKKLFEPFHTTKADGMGIGLSVSRSIVERHQGRLWATRNAGPGATFSFSIPCNTNTKVQ